MEERRVTLEAEGGGEETIVAVVLLALREDGDVLVTMVELMLLFM